MTEITHAQLRRRILLTLAAPFPVNRLSWRVGATNAKRLGCKPWEATEGIALAYIDARDVMGRLDAIQDELGVIWQSEYLPVHGPVVICRIGLFFPGVNEYLWRSSGAGSTQVEAEKGATSDAFKRAAVMWGVGRYLYALPSPWVGLVKGGLPRGFQQELPSWATPEGYLAVLEKRAAERKEDDK